MQQLVVRFASENPSWGYSRIRGALRNLGHELGRNTIKRILLDHGVEPAPARRKRMQWKTFLKAHLGAVCAVDFFSIEVLTLTGLVRTLVALTCFERVPGDCHRHCVAKALAVEPTHL